MMDACRMGAIRIIIVNSDSFIAYMVQTYPWLKVGEHYLIHEPFYAEDDIDPDLKELRNTINTPVTTARSNNVVPPPNRPASRINTPMQDEKPRSGKGKTEGSPRWPRLSVVKPEPSNNVVPIKPV